MRRLVLFGLVVASLAVAETKMTVEQLRGFIKSSAQQGFPDKQIAAYLKQVKLTNKLDDSTIEDIQGLGAGPKTVEALKTLGTATKDLPPPPKPAPKIAAQPIPPPDSKEQAEVLKDATEYALLYAKNLPNFICTQVTRRYADPTGMEFWHLQDTVLTKLSFFEQKEDYKVVMVNNQVVNVGYNELGGATSSGEFGSMLKAIFAPATETRFEWDHWATLRGKRMHVFSYRVAQIHSDWAVVYEKTQKVVPAYRGMIYVDKDTLAVMRVTLEAEDLPVSFPVQQANTVLDYDFIDISGKEFVLPLKATLRMRSGKVLVKNDTEFRLYKKFGAEATITYVPEPLPEAKETPAPK
ncbi:MAG TPA: hypothetical protein VK638_32855 [Edaphobacter sp.]|nr:hypothetical protein [Edaphobacter sp.]